MDDDASTELFREALHQATMIWRDDIQRYFSQEIDVLPAVVWEVVANERRKMESGTIQNGLKVNYAITYARTATESYDRFFPLEPINGGVNLLSYLTSFPDINTNNTEPFRLLLSAQEQQNIAGIQPVKPLHPSRTSTGNGIKGPYSSLPISVGKMSTTKIRNDLDYMWRHRLYTDVQIVVPSSRYDKEDGEERMVDVFSCHRWILMARSPYFRDLLQDDRFTVGDINIVPMPSPPFNPVTVDYILQFLYTGILPSSSDRGAAFAIYRAANFLRIPSLKDLMIAHMISDMMHGFFFPSVDHDEFSQITGGLWKSMARIAGKGYEGGQGGCACRQCSRRAPRMLVFCFEPDINDPLLERGARRALVALFGPGWCTQELGSLPDHLHDLILQDVQDIINPRNALALLFAAEEANEKLGLSPTFWDKPIRRMIDVAKKRIEEVICQQSRPSFFCDEWKDIITLPGRKRKDDQRDEQNRKRLQWIINAIRRTMQPQNAGPIYQTLTWFSDAQVPPEQQNKAFSEIIGNLTGQLYQLMMESRPTSILSSASSIFETIDPAHHSTLDALDLTSTSDLAHSLYSYPSSRTMSTEYGIFYTRLAISQETVGANVQRRRSWDSLSEYNPM